MSKLYKKRFESYYDEYNKLTDIKKNKYNKKFNPKNLKLEDYDYDVWFTEEELNDEEKIDEMLPLEGDEEVKEGKGLKILNPNKLLFKLPILLAQVKAGNDSKKLKSDKYYIVIKS